MLHYGSRGLSKDELKWHTQEKEALAIVWGCNKFRSYLLGSKFKVRTDHHSLQWLMKSEKGRLARWALSMSEFNYEIIHRAGKVNVNADVASRWTKELPDVTWNPFPYYADPITRLANSSEKEVCVNCMSFADCSRRHVLTIGILKDSIKETAVLQQKNLVDLIVESQKIPEFQEVISCVQNGTLIPSSFTKRYLPIEGSLVMQSGILCRSTKLFNLQVLIPNDSLEVKSHIMRLSHDAELAGHLGYQRTLARVRSSYVWPHICRDIQKYTVGCTLCHVHKSKSPLANSQGLHPSLPTGGNARVGIDLIGPLDETPNGNAYCLTMIDYFTKWVVVVPIKSKSSIEVADAIFKYWYTIFGMPYELSSDQGGEFTSDILKRLNDRMSVGHRVTTPYNPQANGAVERYNQTFKKGLAIYAETHAATWDKYVEGLTFSYNSSLNSQTGFSPFYLMFGREARLPIDVLHGPVKDCVHDYKQYGINMTAHMREAYEIVKSNLHAQAEAMQLTWNKKMHESHRVYKPLDEVLMYLPQTNSKSNELDHTHVLRRKWFGPYTLIRQAYTNNPDVYLIRDKQTMREWTVNANKLRPFQKPYLNLMGEDSPSDGQRVTIRDNFSPAESSLVGQPILDPARMFKLPPDKPSAVQVKNLTHRSSSRHKTGMTNKEAKLIAERNKDNLDPDVTLDALKEFEIDSIISHKKVRNRILYEVKWVGIPITSFEPIASFLTTEAISDYWVKQPIDSRPKQFRASKQRGR